MNRMTWVLAIAITVIAGQMAVAASCCETGCCEAAVGCDDGCCNTGCCHKGLCNKGCCCDKCQLICETKTETKHCWNIESKEICPMRPGCMKLDFGPLFKSLGNLGGNCCSGNKCGCSKCGGCNTGCRNTCGQVECCDPACCGEAAACASKPRCGCPITVKKLSKHEYKVEKPAYRCEPVECGPACCQAPAACEAAGCGCE